jgi:hypothetical protein
MRGILLDSALVTDKILDILLNCLAGHTITRRNQNLRVSNEAGF